MPPSLRKACQACTRAKRRCRPELPKCDQCFKKGIDCNYDLEPLVTFGFTPEEPVGASQEEQGFATSKLTYFVFDCVEVAHQAVIQTFKEQSSPEVQMVGDEKVLKWTVSQLR
ncbi:hypothetical protein B7463_g8663, partial [Scytalidium lignicola]